MNQPERVHDQHIFTKENIREDNPGKKEMLLKVSQKILFILNKWILETNMDSYQIKVCLQRKNKHYIKLEPS